MFWLNRHLSAKQALNSKQSAKGYKRIIERFDKMTLVTYIANEQGSDIGSKGVKGVKGFNAVLPTGSDISAIGDIGVLKLEFCSCPSMVKVFSKIVKSIFKCSFFKGPTLIKTNSN